jgi:hypothetical protein
MHVHHGETSKFRWQCFVSRLSSGYAQRCLLRTVVEVIMSNDIGYRWADDCEHEELEAFIA